MVAVLDDEPEMRKALRRLLKCQGFSVEEFACGEDLLSALKSQTLDYVLLDLHMPGLNGFDILEMLHARKSPIPIIVITAYDEPGTADRVRSLGASACLKKPVDRSALMTAMNAARPAIPAVWGEHPRDGAC